MDLFIDALTILRELNRFSTQIEIDIGTFAEHGDLDVEDAAPISLYILQLCVEAYGKGLEDTDQASPEIE